MSFEIVLWKFGGWREGEQLVGKVWALVTVFWQRRNSGEGRAVHQGSPGSLLSPLLLGAFPGPGGRRRWFCRACPGGLSRSLSCVALRLHRGPWRPQRALVRRSGRLQTVRNKAVEGVELEGRGRGLGSALLLWHLASLPSVAVGSTAPCLHCPLTGKTALPSPPGPGWARHAVLREPVSASVSTFYFAIIIINTL